MTEFLIIYSFYSSYHYSHFHINTKQVNARHVRHTTLLELKTKQKHEIEADYDIIDSSLVFTTIKQKMLSHKLDNWEGGTILIYVCLFHVSSFY